MTQHIAALGLDDEQRYQAAVSKDPRFDGVFFIAVTSTGIYCRPSCPAITPKRENMRFYRSAAAAQEAGFRACKRCRPDASPGSPEWNIRADVVGRAMRLIADGVVDRDGVEGLASRLGYEQRQVRRLVSAELGAGPLAIARAQRAQTARILVETTALPLSEIAFAAGFASIRQFNATIHEVFALTPTQLRQARGQRAAPTRRLPIRRPLLPTPADPAAAGLIRLRLAYRAPIDAERMLGFLAARAVPGVESVQDGRYRRTIQLPNGTGILSLGPLVPSPRSATQHRATQHRAMSTASSSSRTCVTLLLRCSAAAACSTWTRTPRPSPATCRPTRCSGRWPWLVRADGHPGTSTAASSRCGPCSASRCRSPRPGGSARGWWPATASRSHALTVR